MLVSQHGAHCEIRDSHSDIVDLEQVLICVIIENDHSASALVKAMDDCEEASSSQAPSVGKRLFGSSLSVTARVFPSNYLVSKGFGRWNILLPEQYVCYFNIQLQCIIYYNRWH